jgi:hypothetical protein
MGHLIGKVHEHDYPDLTERDDDGKFTYREGDVWHCNCMKNFSVFSIGTPSKRQWGSYNGLVDPA